jgi:hypothetical protein
VENGAISGGGAITLTDSTLELGRFNASQLGAFTLNDSNVVVAGTLTATGTTLDVGTGSALGQVTLGVTYPGTDFSGASLVGGTIHDAGGGVQLVGTVSVVGVTYQGTLNVAAPLSSVTLQNVTLQSLNGQHAGAINLTGAGATLLVDGTLDTATLDIGGGAVKYLGQTLYGPDLAPDGNVTSVLGAHLNVVQVGKYATIGSTTPGNGNIVNNGSINAMLPGGQLTLDGSQFINAGSISAAGKEIVTSAASAFLNTGSIQLASGATLALNLLNYYAAPPANGNDGGAVIQGAGLLATQITNFGTIAASTSGGALVLNQAVGGAGTLLADAGATLSLLGQVGAHQVASFGGANAVLGLKGPSFLGTIGGFATSDTIDLLKQTATSAAFSGSSILVTLSTGSTLTLHTTTNLTGALTVTSDGHGGSLIGFAGAAHLGANVPDADWNPAPVASLPPVREAGLMDSVFGPTLLHYGMV